MIDSIALTDGKMPPNHIDAFADCMSKNSLKFCGTLIDDGVLHRIFVEGDKSGSKNGWYVLHGGSAPCGFFGNWKTGLTRSWVASERSELSPQDRSLLDKQISEAKRLREYEREQLAQQVSAKAALLWNAAKPATIEHPYIKRKCIPALGLRVAGTRLFVPIYAIDGRLVNLQTIQPDGTKRFLTGGRIKGCYWLAGAPKLPTEGPLYLCEGVATAATVNQITRVPCVAALNAGNLKRLAELIQWARPELKLTIAADNDHRTDGNPGLTKAKETANALKIPVTVPRIPCGKACTCTDFNDLANCGGKKNG